LSITVIVAYVAISALRIIEVLLFVRAIMSWLPNFSQSQISSFVYYTTEPILAPVRSMLMRVQALRGLPLDFSIIVAYLLIEIIMQFLYMIR